MNHTKQLFVLFSCGRTKDKMSTAEREVHSDMFCLELSEHFNNITKKWLGNGTSLLSSTNLK